MARTTNYPPLYVFEEGEEHEPVSFEPSDWIAVEQAYGHPLSETLRVEIEACCQRYASSRHIELCLQSNAEAEKELDVMLRKLQPFIDFAFSSGWHGTQKATATTRSVVSDQWVDALWSQPFRVRADKVQVFSADANDWKLLSEYTEIPEALIKIDSHVLGEIAQSLAVAGRLAKRNFKMAGEGFAPRHALLVWMAEMRNAFDAFNATSNMRLPVGAYSSEGIRTSNGAAGPFSLLLFELHRRLPPPYREPLLNGPEALAARYRRALRMRSKLAGSTPA